MWTRSALLALRSAGNGPQRLAAQDVRNDARSNLIGMKVGSDLPVFEHKAPRRQTIEPAPFTPRFLKRRPDADRTVSGFAPSHLTEQRHHDAPRGLRGIDAIHHGHDAPPRALQLVKQRASSPYSLTAQAVQLPHEQNVEVATYQPSYRLVKSRACIA